MEVDNGQTPLPFPRFKLEATLVDSYLHQRGEAMIPPLGVHTLFEDLALDIEVLLASAEGRDELFPNLVGRPNVLPAQLAARRERAADHLQVLFCRHVSIKRPERPLMKTLRQVFRRTAVVQAESPALLEGVPKPFNREALWPKLVLPTSVPAPVEPEPVAPTIEPPPNLGPPKRERPRTITVTPALPPGVSIQLAGIQDLALRTRLSDAFAAHLAGAEQAVLMLLYGLDGLGARSYHEIAADLEISQKHARALAAKTLTKLRSSGAITELETFAARATELAW